VSRSDKAITLGHPSYVWRAGQERRLALIHKYAPLDGKRILDVGCGLGMYLTHFREFSPHLFGVDADKDKLVVARQTLSNLSAALAERLAFASEIFDVVLLHEVLEHVADDRQAVREAYRVLARGGYLVIFVPNRLYPFETHGIFWRGAYRFGNIPLVNYLPDRLRNHLAPHVRAYTTRGLRALCAGLDMRLVVHTQIFPGYDNIVRRRPRLGHLLRRVTYTLEATPLRAFGLSHLIVLQKQRSAVSSQRSGGGLTAEGWRLTAEQ